MTETHGPAHLCRVVDGELRVGHPKVCPRWPTVDDETAAAYEHRCGVTVELEAPGATEALIGLAPGDEFLVEFWSEQEDDSAWGPGAYRSGLRIRE